MTDRRAITFVVAAVPDTAFAPALDAVRAAATPNDEILLVGAPLGLDMLGVRCVPCGDALLVPERWAVGMRVAAHPLVATTTTEFVLARDWAERLAPLVVGETVGAATTIGIAASASTTARAVRLLRYSLFLPGAADVVRDVPDIPGDAALYARGAVLAAADLLDTGFWEVEFHRRFRADGRRLLLLQVPSVRYACRPTVRAILRQRFHHGRQFGHTRCTARAESKLRLVVAAPLVPVILVGRILRRLPAAERGAAVGALPLLSLFAAAWALGEAVGALRGPGR